MIGSWPSQPIVEANGLMLRAMSNHQHILIFCFHSKSTEFSSFSPC
ncbi:hypothetical protein SynA1562_01564 [Synechococcus sp. A15-62]|nr:hypothetical protein SynA1562_01564 [Synechococcus sp. A15-62]